MERKIKYQYSYFIYPYIIDENKYDKYLLRLLKDKHCKLKSWEKEKDFNIYAYFLPKVREYLFKSFLYDSNQKRQLEELDINMKSVLLSKNPCTMFEYTLGKDIQAKVGEANGIFFDIQKMDIVCFENGICFLVLKTIIEGENKLSDVLNFNYKFRDINSEFGLLKNYENIRIQTNGMKDIKELSTIIKSITGPNTDAKEMNLEDERFLTYSYACVDEVDWKNEEDFTNLQEEFIKFSNVLPSNYQVNYSEERYKKQVLNLLKYTKIGITKQASCLLTSSNYTENYTKLPFAYEQEYLYTYLLALYKKIYLKKLDLEFKRNKKFAESRKKLLDFTRNIWIQEVTEDDMGSMLYKKWEDTLELEYLYLNIKNKYDMVYKELNVERSLRKGDRIILILLGLVMFNIINFIISYLK